jgi:radical SAM protein with 4Fe4S-binding SPASM domain
MSVPPCHLQLGDAVRLRREAWGGVAFDRGGGDLLEVDSEGFDVLRALKTPRTFLDLERHLRLTPGVSRLQLIAFLRDLEGRRFIRRVSPDTESLPADRWEEDVAGDVDGLRAPLVAHWAVTYRCNLHCAFCYSESGPQRPLGPDAALRRRIVERLAEWGILEVALGGGEPTILPDFPALLESIRTAGMVPNVTTNGTVRGDAVLRALAEHAGVVHLSADRPDLLDSARGAGVFDRLRVTARLLVGAGVRVGVNLLLTPDNAGDLRSSLEALLDLGISAVTFLRPKGPWAAAHWPGFPDDEDMARLAGDLLAFLATGPPLRCYVDTALRGEWARAGLLDDPEPDVLGCGGGQRHVAVSPEGDVYPCSHQRRAAYRMGNLLADDLDQLWDKGAGLVGRRRYLADCRQESCPCRREGVA